ncbi:MAG: lipoprotein signal peptidase [Gammaproteobacteria bacterium]|nr:lipoprotein signal peptidase [Gammaproteobacteria bacterium]
MTALVFVADRATKLLATHFLDYNSPVPVLPSLNFTLVHNTGAAFSFLRDAGGWQRWLFTGIAIVVSVVVIQWIRQTPPGRRLLLVGLALVLAGALGNLYDRVALGYVVDFIDVYYRQWTWPAFNIADSAIFVGAAALVLDAFRSGGVESDGNGAV